MGPTLDPLSLTQALLRFDTINPPGQERDCARFLGKLLEEGGFSVGLHEFAERRTSLVARLDGVGFDAPICFTGHIDTVPLGAVAWVRDPLAGETADGRVYGRGSTDMKSGIAAMVLAALRVARLQPRARGIALVITAGEETGCEGAQHLARSGALGRAGAIVVGEPTGNRPLLGHKGVLWLQGSVTGKAAHGSMPQEGVNAIYRAAGAVGRLERVRLDAPAHPLLTPPTLNVGTISGGRNINSVPDQADFTVDIRSVPGCRHHEILRQLQRCVGDDVAFSTLLDLEGIASDQDDPWVRQVFDTVAAITGQEVGTAAAPYFTDASVLTPAYGEPPTVILGPGEMALAHQTDEYCLIDRIEEVTEIYTELATAWCQS